ncbi:hypothetical protein B0H17DRAFT_1201339 [Mycena rosella]|uniref:MYND-type domain-containing protein n=1 Tax=Mycena rosella TaxID=1033263 RepID=A0AAD7DGR2_MYCRO|nr:hypothetical protein B0H17DRAFT_1201339 [Mycena rosella]
MSLETLRKGLATLKEGVKKRKDALALRLKKREKMSKEDEAWLDNAANHVDEDALIVTLENASDSERGLSHLDSKQKGMVQKLKEIAGGGEEAAEMSRKRKSEIVAHDPTGNLRVKSLYLFPHPAVEHEYSRYTREYPNSGALEDLRAFEYLRIVQRNLYIVQTLIGILEAYTGKPAPKISLHDERKRFQQGGGCYSCGATSTEDGITLKKCSGCKLMTYCSSECQQRDWRDHKKLCGTPPAPFDPALVTSTPEAPANFISCPTPDAGFVRSPALWRQIWYLSKKDSYSRDYHFDTTPGNTRSVRIQDPVLRLMFLIARRRAMASGDRGAVGKMHDVLVRQQRAGAFDVTLLQIPGQLEREYRVELTAVMSLAAPPTPQEMIEELEYSGRRDRLAEAEWNRQRGVQDDESESKEEGGNDEDEDEDEDEATA